MLSLVDGGRSGAAALRCSWTVGGLSTSAIAIRAAGRMGGTRCGPRVPPPRSIRGVERRHLVHVDRAAAATPA
ncbi:MAG TPA: hypothetical protein VKB80_00150, partial [Kofleriaceae bacterium]|nr:hypothetical protein [Kofleriaceae bacterium]